MLPYRHNTITFEFAAIEPIRPSMVNYQYMLVGYDDDWSPKSNKTFASFGNMNEGTYTFKLKAQSPFGVWSQPVSYTFTVLPSWWRTWWFRFLVVTLLAASIYGMFRYRLQQILRQREAEIKASLMAQETERQRLSRELHDGVGANLALLKMYLSAYGDPNMSMDTLKVRSESLLDSSVDDIRRLINDMHPRNLKELGLVGAVEEMVQVINRSRQVRISFVADVLPNRLSEPMEINLYRIIQELLQNAVKHAGSADIAMQLTQQGDKLELSYNDNGKGFDTGVASSGNGLLNIRNRVEMLKGKVEVKSAIGEGTKVKIETQISS